MAVNLRGRSYLKLLDFTSEEIRYLLFEESREAFFNQYPDAKGYKCGFENIKKVDFEFTSEKLKNMIKKEKDESNE